MKFVTIENYDNEAKKTFLVSNDIAHAIVTILERYRK
jgi:hypothetical protein